MDTVCLTSGQTIRLKLPLQESTRYLTQEVVSIGNSHINSRNGARRLLKLWQCLLSQQIGKAILILLATSSLALSTRAQSNIVYAVEFNQSTNRFGTINLLNGSFTKIASIGGSLINDVGSCPTNGMLYGISNTTALVTFNKANGAMTRVATLSVSSIQSLAFRPSDGALFGATRNRLYTINITNGTATSVGLFGSAHNLGSTGQNIRFAPDGNLYVSNTGTNTDIYRVNTTTGAATWMGEAVGFPYLILENGGANMYGVYISLGSSTNQCPVLTAFDFNSFVVGGTNANGSAHQITLNLVGAGTNFPANFNFSGNTSQAVTNLTIRVGAVGPVPQTACPGDNVTFSTVASGTGPYSYAWMKNSAAISGQTNSTLTLNNVSAGDAATYSVIVNGLMGSVTNSATLTVNTPVTATPLSNATACPGDSATFSTVASGTGPFSYLWLKNGTLISGQNSSSLTLNNVGTSDTALYSVIVSGFCASVTNNATLTVNVPVTVTVAPLNQTTVVGSNVTFSVTASGTSLSYQWLSGGSVIGTSSSLILNNVTIGQAGIYTAIVRGACGSPATNNATLTVNVPVTVTVAPVSQTTLVGSNVTFSVTATGTALSYQWLFNGAVIGNANSLTLNNVNTGQAGIYTVIVSGAGTPVTNNATLTVNVPVTVTVAPVSQTTLVGSNVTFSVTATGTALSYQWLFGGSVIGTSSSLTLNNVTTGQAGIYTAIVSGAGTPVTNNATLTVNIPVTATPLSNLVRCQGDDAVFSTAASGTGPFSYIWLKSGIAISGQTGNSLNLNNVNTNDAATYAVIVCGACGSTTNSATLVVNMPSPPTLSITCQEDGSVKVCAAGGVSGQKYILLSSTNLVNWTVVSTNTADSTGASEFIDSDATNYSNCFFRTETPQ